jgi:hypothetical protein
MVRPLMTVAPLMAPQCLQVSSHGHSLTPVKRTFGQDSWRPAGLSQQAVSSIDDKEISQTRVYTRAIT